MNRMKLILIGTGGFGQIWLNAIDGMEEIELVAIADLSESNLVQAQNLLQGKGIHVPSYRSPQQALAETLADIALLVTPPHTHKDLTIQAVEHGLHVLLEKPVTSEFSEAVELEIFARGCNRKIMVNQNYRWQPQIEALRIAVADGIVGPIEQVEWRFARSHKDVNFSSGWRSGFHEIFLREMSIHHLDLMRHILGQDPVSVYAETHNPSWSWVPAGGTASALLKFEGNIAVNYSGTWVNRGTDTPWNGNVRLLGSKGAIDLIDDIPYLVSEDGTRERLPMSDLKYSNSMSNSLYELVRAIREDRRPVTDVTDNLISWLLVCAADESVRKGARATIDKKNKQFHIL
jgi:predicted dehydrogenase